MHRMNHASRRLALAAIAGLAASVTLAAPALGQGCVVTKCEWTNPGGPSSTLMYTPWVITDEGTLWDTKERKCTTCYSGPAMWCTWARSKSCTQSTGVGVGLSGPSISIGSAYGYSDAPPTWTTGNGTAKKCVKQSSCLWTSETEVQVHQVHKAGDARRDQDAAVPAIALPSVIVFNETRYTHESLVNEWAASMVTFDGARIPFGGAIPLDRYSPGQHVYVVTPSPSLGFPFRALRFNINVQRSSTLQNVSSFINIIPMATMRYTNNSPYEQFIDVSAFPEQVGLIAELDANQFTVAAGSSVDIGVQFYTFDGYVMEPGQQYTSRIEARDAYPGGVIFASGQAIALEPARADVNADGRVDSADLDAVISFVGAAAEKALEAGIRADVVLDGVIDEADVIEMTTLMHSGAEAVGLDTR